MCRGIYPQGSNSSFTVPHKYLQICKGDSITTKCPSRIQLLTIHIPQIVDLRMILSLIFQNKVKCLNCQPHEKMAERPKQSLRKIKWFKKNLKFVWYVKTLPLQKLLFEMNAAWLCTFPSPYVFDKHGKQIVEGDAIVYCQYIELFLLFFCRHNNASSAEESWHNRQSHFFHHGECKRQQGK